MGHLKFGAPQCAGLTIEYRVYRVYRVYLISIRVYYRLSIEYRRARFREGSEKSEKLKKFKKLQKLKFPIIYIVEKIH